MARCVPEIAVKLISWNINQQEAAWCALVDSGVDVALLQEARMPPAGLALESDEAAWKTAGAGMRRAWRAAVARLSDRVKVDWRDAASIPEADYRGLRVSRSGTLAIADVRDVATGECITVASVYAAWESPAGDQKSSWIYADASAHRVISDLSALIRTQKNHRLIVSGDWNILYGYGESGVPYWANRYQTVFDRMAALGIPFAGPQHPNGNQADPWPDELPVDSKNVPTFKPKTGPATRQLDFVFASEALHDRLQVTALNAEHEWGPSDHCRVMIELASA